LIIGKNITLYCLKFLYNIDMGMNQAPSSNRIHITFFGCRNTGLVNAVTGQNPAVVSPVLDKKRTGIDYER
jgi:hypothetical protein